MSRLPPLHALDLPPAASWAFFTLVTCCRSVRCVSVASVVAAIAGVEESSRPLPLASASAAVSLSAAPTRSHLRSMRNSGDDQTQRRGETRASAREWTARERASASKELVGMAQRILAFASLRSNSSVLQAMEKGIEETSCSVGVMEGWSKSKQASLQRASYLFATTLSSSVSPCGLSL